LRMRARRFILPSADRVAAAFQPTNDNTQTLRMHKFIDWTLSWSLRLLVAGLAIASLVYLVESWPTQSEVDTLHHASNVREVTPFLNLGCSPTADAPVVQFTLQKLDFVGEGLTTSAALCLSSKFLATLRTTRTHSPIVTIAQDGSLSVRRPYRRATIAVEIGVFFFPEYVTSITLGKLIQAGLGDTLTGALRTFIFPTFGFSQDYPFDQYEAQGTVFVEFPSWIVSDKRQATGAFEAHPDVSEAANLTQFSVTTGQVDVQNLVIVIQRTGASKRFVLGLLGLFAAVVLALVLYVARSRRGLRGTDLFVAAAAIFIALLPLRAVLVPAGLSDFTLVDLSLGCLIAFLVAVGVWSMPIPPLRRAGKRRAHGDEQSAEREATEGGPRSATSK
jgi:hypothetical protein